MKGRMLSKDTTQKCMFILVTNEISKSIFLHAMTSESTIYYVFKTEHGHKKKCSYVLEA